MRAIRHWAGFFFENFFTGEWLVKATILAFLGCLGVSISLGAETLGFIQQKFSDLHFEKGNWTRTVQLPCYTYEAQADGAVVEILRIGMGNLVQFKAKKGLKVTVCGSVAAFDEGFEATSPVPGETIQQQNR
jgi:hypothetical protein